VERVLEPELMLDPEQARAYAAGDFEAPHSHCVALLLDRLGPLAPSGLAVDLGCGPADISLRLLRRLPGWSCIGIDASPAMLALGRAAAREAGLEARLALHERRLPTGGLPGAPFDLVLSNSLLHHLPDPAVLWSTAIAAARPGAPLFAMDLHRPDSLAEVRDLVARHASREPEVLRRDFEASLRAACTIEEVRDQLARAGLRHLEVERVSDRHWIAWGVPRPDERR
jgi:SAM-dependent methyltransferase